MFKIILQKILDIILMTLFIALCVSIMSTLIIWLKFTLDEWYERNHRISEMEKQRCLDNWMWYKIHFQWIDCITNK